MEVYNKDSKFYNAIAQTRSWVSTFLGVIVTVVGVAVVFMISALEGTKEIQVSNSMSVEILNYWRDENRNNGFPEERAEIIEYEGRSYYFIEGEDGWYFAYDGGLDYIFRDFKFYLLTSITIMVAMYVANINYVSTIKQMRNTDIFVKTLSHYQKTKEKIEKHTQYIPDFCAYKNKQAFDMAKRAIIESADINYQYYLSDEFKYHSLQDWQKKLLKDIEKIKVKRIQTSDLLQEHGFTTKNIQILPMSEKEHQRMYTIRGGIQRVVSSILSGTVVAFGVVLGNWVLGITYGMVVVMSFVSAIVIASDFVTSTLRNRYIAKADLLNEFDNIKDIFIPKELRTPTANNLINNIEAVI
jgi:hypothetical protein